MKQLIVYTPEGEWIENHFNIGDSVIYNGCVQQVRGFQVLQAPPYIDYDLGVGHSVPQDELEGYSEPQSS